MRATTTRQIAEFVHATRLKDIPTEVVDYAKLLGLSHVGMNIAGTRMKVGKTVIQYVQRRGGPAEAGIFGTGLRAPVEYATMANANSAHSTELEDDSFPETMYSCGHWPAVFALSEKYGLSGDRLLEALIIGYEVAARLGLAFDRGMKKGWASWAALGTIGNGVAAAKLMNLDVDQTVAAISLSVSQSAGLLKQTGSGAHIIEAGFAGRDGIVRPNSPQWAMWASRIYWKARMASENFGQIHPILTCSWATAIAFIMSASRNTLAAFSCTATWTGCWN